MDTTYGSDEILPAAQAQMAYTQNEGYEAWGLSDCFDVADGPYVQQGAPPAAMAGFLEAHPGLVGPHAGALAPITPLSSEVISKMRIIYVPLRLRAALRFP